MEAYILKDYVWEYVKKSRRHLLNPRTIEVPKISDQFGKWYDSVINSAWKDKVDYPVLVLKEDFKAAQHFMANKPVIFENIFSAHIYPQHAICDHGHFIIWDSHFWDLYSFWLVSALDLTMNYEIYTTGIKTISEAKTDYEKRQNNFKGIMLLFLASRFDNSPLLSYVIAEKYSNEYDKFTPRYNQPYSMGAGKTVTVEDYLEMTSLYHFSDYAKQFVFLHESTHIKLRTQTSERKIAFERVKNYCKTIVDLNNIAEKLDISESQDKIINSFANKVLKQKDNELIEEIYCDYNAMVNACRRIIDETGSEKKALLFLLSVSYISLFLQWLDSSEKEWLLCAEILDAENEQNEKKKIYKQIKVDKKSREVSKEMDLINARKIFSFSMACDTLKIYPNESEGILASQFEMFTTDWFNDKFLPLLYATYSGPFVMETLRRMEKIKQSKIPLSELTKKRNEFIGWEEWDGNDTEDEESSSDDRSQKEKYYEPSKNPITANNFKLKQKREALCRIDELTDTFDLNPKIKQYYKKGMLYYSYLTADGMIGSIDTIKYDERYPKVVKKFEKGGNLVYHCVEHKDTLSCLFVGAVEDEWASERVHRGKILAYIYDFANPAQSKIDNISVDAFGESGAIIRYR